MDPQAAFQILQPASIAVARHQSVESVQALCHAIEQVLGTEKDLRVDACSSCISELKEYLIFPLLIILKSGKKLSWLLQEELVRCLLIILKNSSVDDFKFFLEIFSQLFILLTNKNDPQQTKHMSEECKQMALTTVTVLVHNSSGSVHEKMNGGGFRPQLGHAVFMCLKMAQEERNRSLRIEAINCLCALGQQKFFSKLSEKKQSLLSNNFTNFLPGIVTGLAKIANGDEKQGHKITSAAVEAWTYFTILVMRDEFLAEKVSHMEESETVTQLRAKLFKIENKKDSNKNNSQQKRNQKFYIPEPDEEDISSKLPSIQIDRKWIHETSEKLVVLIQSMSKLVSHPHWKVRLSLILLAERLISRCHKSISGAVILALQVIVTLRSDDIVDVGSAAENALLSVMNVIGCESKDSPLQKGLYEMLEEHVYALCTKLPTIFKQQDDTKTLSSMQQLMGCLEVLGDRISQLMTWPTHSMRLLRSLRLGLTVDIEDSDLLMERTNAEDPFGILALKPSLGRNFKYFRDVRIFQCIASSCNLIGYHSNVTLTTDLCLELLQESLSRKETYILLTFIIRGRDQSKLKDKDRSCPSSEEQENVVQSILDVMISQEIFDVPLSVVTSSTPNARQDEDEIMTSVLVPVNRLSNISVDMVKSNVMLVTSALNLVSACAQMIGKGFEMFLSNIMCSVMEKAGDSNVLVGYVGRNTLEEIAQVCGYENIAKLIENSVPHYWYALSLKLKRLHQYPSAPLVLQVCLEYASIDVIAFTEELVQDVLLCLDAYHSDQALPLLRVLLVFVLAVIKYESKLPSEDKSSEADGMLDSEVEKSDTQKVKDSETVSEGLMSFLNDYHAQQLHIKESLAKEEPSLANEEIRRDLSEDKEDCISNMMDEMNEPEESKEDTPMYIKHVVEIVEKCSHMLYIQERKLKLLILEIVKAAASALEKWENERLPVFHKLWKPLVLRLKDVDFIVMMRSFEVLTLMCVSSGDFLRRRIVKEIFPAVFTFLRNQGAISLNKTKKSGYHMTSGYRAQCVLLSQLPVLVRTLSLGVLETGNLLEVLMLYLDTQQPQQLLKSSFIVVKEISMIRPQHVWLALAYQQPPVRIIPPSPNLDAVHIRSVRNGHLPIEAVELYQELS